jgi:hypothetical protein
VPAHSRFKALVPICPLAEPAAAPLSDADAADYASMLAEVGRLSCKPSGRR